MSEPNGTITTYTASSNEHILPLHKVCRHADDI
jgi:hypothetical protein